MLLSSRKQRELRVMLLVIHLPKETHKEAERKKGLLLHLQKGGLRRWLWISMRY